MAWLATTVFTLICTIACANVARSQSLDLQERCASQARKAFQELENDFKTESADKTLGTVHGTNNYQSHYNTKLKRCLMLINRSDYFSAVGTQSNQWFLVDANERRFYATYGESKLEPGRTEAHPPTCELTPSIRQKTLCKTREEFDGFCCGVYGGISHILRRKRAYLFAAHDGKVTARGSSSK